MDDFTIPDLTFPEPKRPIARRDFNEERAQEHKEHGMAVAVEERVAQHHLLVEVRHLFEAPVRLGIPSHVGGLQDVVRGPMYATGVGLVLYGARNQDSRKFRIRDKNIFNRVMTRMKRWFNEVV